MTQDLTLRITAGASNTSGAALLAAEAPTADPQIRAIQPPTVPSNPSVPNVPGPALGNSSANPLNQAGDALGTALQAPGRALPHTGN